MTLGRVTIMTIRGGTPAPHAARGDEVVALILTHGGRIHPTTGADLRAAHPVR
jgi:LmbE family N-acetylglucosaminyl deacetylase